ncbi:hypothetical protein C8Q75DRAFT_435704 [Abortiporus biennis]|nr:hypothetical protein C8Q75DRAFT_435704 [Abortiporus biennis]
MLDIIRGSCFGHKKQVISTISNYLSYLATFTQMPDRSDSIGRGKARQTEGRGGYLHHGGRGRGSSTKVPEGSDQQRTENSRLGNASEGRRRKLRDLDEDLNLTLLCTIPRPEIHGDSGQGNLEIENLVCIGSYSWIDGDIPTILVPGAPRVWTNKTLPYHVEHDSWGFIDQNACRFPLYPLLPLFKAVEVGEGELGEKEKVDWAEVDFVTDRNNLRKLLRWVSGKARGKQDFRIDTQLAGKRTVLFTRFEQRVIAMRGGSGFGSNFEKVSTKPVPGCERTTGYHRIVKYNIDGLVLVVRFEVDACLEDDKVPNLEPNQPEVDALSGSMAGLAVSESPPFPPEIPPNDLNIIRAGTAVSQKNIIELSTRSKSGIEWEEVYPQLFLSQTPHFFMATHKDGEFHTLRKERMESSQMMQMREKHDTKFRMLASALRSIQNLVADHGKNGRLSLLLRERELKVYERESKAGCLPDDFMACFEDKT